MKSMNEWMILGLFAATGCIDRSPSREIIVIGTTPSCTVEREHVQLGEPGVAATLDDVIAYRLQELFYEDHELSRWADRVTIDVVNGRVVLRGVMPSPGVRAAFDRAARTTPGVLHVTNALAAP